ncbi:MAG: heme exporter protein CcmB [Pseudomonadota bacterium]|nr:heme exporter protein CcmB [Pseudomonadota bacterium]
MKNFFLLIKREIKLAFRQIGDSGLVVTFFLLATIFFPIGLGPEPVLLSEIGPGIIWVTALLAAIISFERLFSSDYDDGTLEQLALSDTPIGLISLTKALAHWVTTGFPITITAPIVSILYQMPEKGYLVLITTLALGTPTISLIGVVGAALTLGAQRGRVLLALLVLPLMLPILILGTSATDAAIAGTPWVSNLLLMGALFLGTLVITPLATTAALRLALE